MVDHRLERRGQIARHVVFPPDLDAFKEGLVERSAQPIRCPHVRGVAVLCQVERVAKVLIELFQLQIGVLHPFFNRGELDRESLLFGLVEIGGNEPIEVTVEQLLLSRLQPSTLQVQFVLEPDRFVCAVGQVLAEGRFDVAAQLGCERDRLIEPQHAFFDHVDRDRRLLAVRPLLVTTAADEVLVDDPVTVLRVLDDQAAVAFGADDRALQVVIVGALLLADGVEREHVLYALPGHGVDERLVTARVGHALKCDETLVVRVGQHLLKLGWGDRLRGPSGCRAGGETAQREFFGETAQRPFAGRVGDEGMTDERGALFVRDHRAYFAPLFIEHALVAVAKRRLSWGAASLGLLDHALEHFVGEVAGVELGDGTHDAVEQHAGWRLVDVLGRGDELDAGVLECEVDLDVVGATAGEAVDLVDDAVGDRVLADVLQHPLEFGSVSGAGGLTTVDEDLDDLSA